MQTAVEWLIDQLEKHHVHHNLKDTVVFEQAKEMERKSMIDFGNDLIAQNDSTYIGVPNLAEIYYNETYGSKGSDETNGNNVEKVPNVTSSQTEISDEDIEKESEKYPYGGREGSKRMSFIEGAKWYREQLKSRQ